MLYLTQVRLMLESEQSVAARAHSDEEVSRRVCAQLLADRPRYELWHSRQEGHMDGVARARRRERQILALRSVAIEQIHRAALVRHLRDQRITGTARDLTLREFYGVLDAREATIAEHRSYVLAASTQYCAADILELAGDRHGLDMLSRYELAYTQYFGMFCDRARARRAGERYLLENLLPEVRDAADRLRARVLDGDRLAPAPRRVERRAALERASKPLGPRPQIELVRPGRSRLSM